MITCSNDRMLELLWFIGYCVEFPTSLAARIGGGVDWNRHVMYKAIKEGYVELFRTKYQRHIIRSLSLTQKGLDYIAVHDPDAVSVIYSRVSNAQKVYPSRIEKIVRLHAIAVGVVMANAAGARILPSQKPSLLSAAKRAPDSIVPSPDDLYYYSSHEIRAAIEEYSAETVSKSSRMLGVIVSGRQCYILYYTGRTRMFWMQNSEENYAAAIKSHLVSRGFGVTTVHQVVIGSSMSVALRLCHNPNRYGHKYFVVSPYFAECIFLTNNQEGDLLLKALLRPELIMAINCSVLAPFLQPTVFNRGYDAIDAGRNKPVILNYQCDLLKLADDKQLPQGFGGTPIMLCLDYQVETVQRIVGPAVEVQPIESERFYELTKTENST